MGRARGAPQGVCTDSPTNRTFVTNFLSRSLTVLDTDSLFRSGNLSVTASDVSTVSNESLAPNILIGKQVFYNAGDPRMSAEGYLSCATCHLDGGHDGRVWDFTGRGEGLRRGVRQLMNGPRLVALRGWVASRPRIENPRRPRCRATPRPRPERRIP